MNVLVRVLLVVAAAVAISSACTCNTLVDYCAKTGNCVCADPTLDNCCVMPDRDCARSDDCCGNATCVGGKCQMPTRRNGDVCAPPLMSCDAGSDCCSNLCANGICRCHTSPLGHCESKFDCCYPGDYSADLCGSDQTCRTTGSGGGSGGGTSGLTGAGSDGGSL